MSREWGFTLAAAFCLGGAAFFLLCGYEFARPASYSLFIDAYGAERLPWVLTLSPMGTLAMVYAYGRLLSRLGASRTLMASHLLSGAGMLLCYALTASGIRETAFAFYVLRESYIVLLIEQYWSFIDSTLTPQQARRINGPILGIGSLGGMLGGLFVGMTAEVYGTELFVLFAAVSAVPAAALGALAYRFGGEPKPSIGSDDGDPSVRDHMGLGMFRRYRILFAIAFVVASSQVVATVLDIRLGLLVDDAFPSKDEITAFYGFIFSGINAGALALQFVVTPLLLRYVPLVVVHIAIPALHVISCTILLIHPTLSTGVAAFLIFKCVDYSLFRAGKEILYMPLPYEARYRAKELIDAFGYRASKGGTSALLSAAGAVLGRLPAIAHAGIAVLTCLLWLAFVVRLRSAVTDGGRAQK